MANLGLPGITIDFKGLGTSAVDRGEKGTAVLIIKDDTDTTFTFAEYASVSDLTSTEEAKYTADNLEYINDVLEGTPLNLIVARMGTLDSLNDLLNSIKGYVPRNCWIAMADGDTDNHDAIVSFVKSQVTNNYKRYKALVYDATVTDDMHIVNFTNTYVTFADDRGKVSGNKAVPWLLGLLSGLSLSLSVISKSLTIFDSVTEPDDLEAAVNAGQFVLYNDEGTVKVARGVNSLITTGDNVTDDMKFILIVETMDLIYCDLYDTWKNSYKGKYKNYMDNQLLLVGAINAYFEGLETDLLLDPNYDNEAEIDVETQRLANVSKYGTETVNGWSDEEAMAMTYGTQVYLTANIKILNAMEDFTFTLYM